MAVLKPRERLVYFRVSEDEFRQFVSVCEQAGARSLSDLARSAVQRLIQEGARQREDDQLADRMHRLEKLISKVTEQLQLLNYGNGNEAHLNNLPGEAVPYLNGAGAAQKDGDE